MDGYDANNGSGGGGGGGASGRDNDTQIALGGKGASGCVIIRFPSSYSDPTINGTTDYTTTPITSGGYKMIKYISTAGDNSSSTGTITFNQ